MTGGVTSSGPASGSSSRSGSIYSNQLEQRMFDNAALHSQQRGTAGLQDSAAAKAPAASVPSAAAGLTNTNTGIGSKPHSSGGAARTSNSGGSQQQQQQRVPISSQLFDLAESLKQQEAECKARSQQLDAERARSAVAEEKAAAMCRELDGERRRAKVSKVLVVWAATDAAGSDMLRAGVCWGVLADTACWVLCLQQRCLNWLLSVDLRGFILLCAVVVLEPSFLLSPLASPLAAAAAAVHRTLRPSSPLPPAGPTACRQTLQHSQQTGTQSTLSRSSCARS
jgi:hypothetical protein